MPDVRIETGGGAPVSIGGVPQDSSYGLDVVTVVTGVGSDMMTGKHATEWCAIWMAPAARRTIWALTLPQVAATLAAALVATKTFNAAGQPLLDTRMFNGVLIMVLFTSILGPLLVQRFAPGMAGSATRVRAARGSVG